MNKIQLTPSMFIAKGRDRACYRHPFQENLCIKVAIKPERQSLKEKSYLQFLAKRKVDLHLISQYKGRITTNLGTGYLFDLAIDYGGQLSQTLTQTIIKKALSQETVDQLLTTLKCYLEENAICVKDISPNNLAYIKTCKHKGYLYIIDGIGNPNNNPLTIRIKWLAQSTMQKPWARLERKVNHLYQPNVRANYHRNKVPKTNKRLPLVTLSIIIFITSFSLLTIE